MFASVAALTTPINVATTATATSTAVVVTDFMIVGANKQVNPNQNVVSHAKDRNFATFQTSKKDRTSATTAIAPPAPLEQDSFDVLCVCVCGAFLRHTDMITPTAHNTTQPTTHPTQ